MQAVEGSLIQTLDKDKRWKQFFFFFELRANSSLSRNLASARKSKGLENLQDGRVALDFFVYR